MELYKLTEAAAEILRQRASREPMAADFAELKYADIVDGATEKARKLQQENGTFDVIISTEDIDRTGEIVKQDGWDLANYKNNPIVLWGHDYYSLGIGVCLETYNTTYRGIPALGARGVFYSGDINPLAQQVRKMYEFGIKMGTGAGCTTSVGFIPKEFDPKDQNVITRSELLEFSFVPIPANQGVGPAQGRAITIEEAKELGLDIAGLSVKGLSFAEKKAEGKPGDACQLDDGTPGVLVADPKDPDAPLSCVADTQDKGAKKDGMGKLSKAIETEHGRHEKCVSKALDEFKTKAAAVIEDQPDMNDEDEDKKKAARSSAATEMKKCLKTLQDRLAEEHDMHRAKNVESFRSYTPPDEKKEFGTIDDCVKALKAEHTDYETKCGKSFDEFKEKCMKTVSGDMSDGDEDDGNTHTDWITGEMAGHQGAHKDAVKGIASEMGKGFGEGEESEEKGLWLELKSILEQEGVDTEVIEKVGAKLSAATKDKLEEAHGHMMKGIAIIRALHGALGDKEPDGDEPQAEPDEKDGHVAATDEGLTKYLQARTLARSLAGTLNEVLSESKGLIKDYNRRGK